MRATAVNRTDCAHCLRKTQELPWIEGATRYVRRCYRTPRRMVIGIKGESLRISVRQHCTISLKLYSPRHWSQPVLCAPTRPCVTYNSPPQSAGRYVALRSLSIRACLGSKMLRRLLHGSATSRQGCFLRKVAADSRFKCRTRQPTISWLHLRSHTPAQNATANRMNFRSIHRIQYKCKPIFRKSAQI